MISNKDLYLRRISLNKDENTNTYLAATMPRCSVLQQWDYSYGMQKEVLRKIQKERQESLQKLSQALAYTVSNQN